MKWDQVGQFGHAISRALTSNFQVIKFKPVREISNNGMCDQQSLRSACAYAQSDQSLY